MENQSTVFRLKRGKLKTRCERKQRNYNGNGWKQTRKALRVLDLAVVVLVAIPATRQYQLWEILPLYLQILTNPASQPYSKYGYWQSSNHLQKHFLWSVICLQWSAHGKQCGWNVECLMFFSNCQLFAGWVDVPPLHKDVIFFKCY